MSADYSFELKNIEIWVPAFFKHNNSSVATVKSVASDFNDFNMYVLGLRVLFVNTYKRARTQGYFHAYYCIMYCTDLTCM